MLPKYEGMSDNTLEHVLPKANIMPVNKLQMDSNVRSTLEVDVQLLPSCGVAFFPRSQDDRANFGILALAWSHGPPSAAL